MDSCGNTHRRRFGLVLLAAAAAALIVLVPSALGGITGAITTTFVPPATCVHGSPTNCNTYANKGDVYLSGIQNLEAGTYFFAVIVPGNSDPADGGVGNLSDMTCDPYTCPATNGDGSSIPTGDTYVDREFSVDGSGNVTPLGSHLLDGNNIQIAPFDDTTNNGGVYKLVVCRVAEDGSPDTQNCKSDNFKVLNTCTDNCTVQPEGDLIVTKTATPSFSRDYDWSVLKAQTTSGTPIDAGGSTTPVNYKVTATWSGPNDSGWTVTGTITVQNPNGSDFTGVDITDSINDGNAACSVTDVNGGLNETIPANSSPGFPYTCTYSAAPGTNAETNTATATWDPLLNNTNDAGTTSGTADFTFDDGSVGNPTVTHDTTTVTDTFNGGAAQTLGVATVAPSWTTDSGNHLTGFAETYDSGTNTFTLTYTRAVAVVPDTCTTYNNTATISPDATAGDNSSSASVTVCGRAAGGLTMGFWQNKNGQGIITGGSSTAGVCNLGTWLRAYNPFSNLAANATCTQVAAYVTTIIKAATCSTTVLGPCNAMLRAQMLATALDVYFSDPTLGGDKIKAFNGGNAVSIGGVSIDLTNICKMIDGSGGTATCSGSYENTSSAFDGSCETVSDLLEDAAGFSGSGGTPWYSQNKALQVLAKDTFDAINNQVAFTC